MTSHLWGDPDFDWDALNDAAMYIAVRCRQFARCGVMTKEKYGTLRLETTGAFASEYSYLHNMIYPGYAYYQWPKWVRQWVDQPVGKLFNAVGIVYLTQWYQIAVLKYFWKRAAKKWPHIKEEILDEWEIYFEEIH